REDLAAADADVFLVELKAAAVDVVVEEASRRGVRVVVAANDIVPLPGESLLDETLERLAAEAVALAPERVRSRCPSAGTSRRFRSEATTTRPGRRGSCRARSRRPA